MYILSNFDLRKLPNCWFPYGHVCIKAIRILRMNKNIKEPISLLLTFVLSFLNLNYLSYRHCLCACGIFTALINWLYLPLKNKRGFLPIAESDRLFSNLCILFSNKGKRFKRDQKGPKGDKEYTRARGGQQGTKGAKRFQTVTEGDNRRQKGSNGSKEGQNRVKTGSKQVKLGQTGQHPI